MRRPAAPLTPPDESLLRLLEAEERAAAMLREADADARLVLDEAQAAASEIEAETEAEIAAALQALEARLAAEREAAVAALTREVGHSRWARSEAELRHLAERVIDVLLEHPDGASGGAGP